MRGERGAVAGLHRDGVARHPDPEIAAELLLAHGTEEQKARLLPVVSGRRIVPTAVFLLSRRLAGLGSLRTRAVRDGETGG